MLSGSAATGSSDHKEGVMKSKDIIKYLSLIVLIIGASAVTPMVIRAVSDYLVERIEEGAAGRDAAAGQTEEETEGTLQLMAETEDITEGTRPDRDFLMTDKAAEGTGAKKPGSRPDPAPTDEREEEAQERIRTDQALAKYEAAQHPAVTYEERSMYDIFIGDREKAFTNAMADFLFSVYGDVLSIEEIRVEDFVDENEQEVTCRIRLTVSYKGERESGYYLARYNADYDFYSIYAYRE